MCGIVGQMGTSINEAWIAQELLNLRHRGPDYQSSIRVNENLLMGSTRLAMTDPNPRSNQPMVSELGPSVITFNGEIYNYRELRKRLEKIGIVFKTESDTEVLIKWIDVHGVSGFPELNGMYALAYYSRLDKRLVLARDHLGKKPLFTLINGGNLYWSSSLSSLIAHLGKPRLNRKSIYQYFSLGYTLDPNSILNGIHTVMPGEVISYNQDLTWVREKIVPSSRSKTDLRETLITAVKNRVEGHPNVALSMSGGLDSTIIAVALSELGVTYKTYSAIWNDSDKTRYNTDAIVAKDISRKLGVQNLQIQMISSKNLQSEIDKFVRVMQEPNNNPSGISMLKLYEEISKSGNRLVLTGDGADELFGGYARHSKVAKGIKVFPIPAYIQNWIASGERTARSRVIQNFATSQMNAANPLSWLHWHWVFRPVDTALLMPTLFNKYAFIENLSEVIYESSTLSSTKRGVQFLLDRDRYLWLVNESNRKLDRISMEYSIEARSPFQDDEVIALSQELMQKTNYKILNKDMLRNVFPETVSLGVRDEKAGFTSPVGHWLRSNPDFLAESIQNLYRYGFFSRPYLEKLITAPNTGSYKLIMQTWTTLIFSRWIHTLGPEVEF